MGFTSFGPRTRLQRAEAAGKCQGLKGIVSKTSLKAFENKNFASLNSLVPTWRP